MTRALYMIPLCAALMAGCGKVTDERTIQVNPAEVQSIIYNALRGEKKVSIAVSAQGAPVSAYIVLEKERHQAVERMGNNQKPGNPLGQFEKKQEGVLEATIPAKEEFALLLSHESSKPVQVKVVATR